MKKLLAMILAMAMVLSFAACGQSASEETAKEETPKELSAVTATDPQEEQEAPTEEELFQKEGTLKDGTTYVLYRRGGPEGEPVRAELQYPDGTFCVEYYDANGNVELSTSKEVDGSYHEIYLYPSGGIHKTMSTYADGSYEEYHYLDDGSVDEAGWVSSGTMIYEKHISADGYVEENAYDIVKEADGSWWTETVRENGIVAKTHFDANGKPIQEITTDSNKGTTTVAEFYESGKAKSRTTTKEGSIEYYYDEFYENGLTKVSKYIGEDKREINYECNEEGYYTYYYDRSHLGAQEYFAGENNELVKYIENGKVYEGNSITANQKNAFKQMQDMAAKVAYNILNGI